MGLWDYYRATSRDYHRGPFKRSLLRTREAFLKSLWILTGASERLLGHQKGLGFRV